MKIKEMLLPLSLALLTTWGLQYYFGTQDATFTDKGTVQTGQQFTAPTIDRPEVHKPLAKEVDFLDSKQPRKTETTTIETPHALYEFSNDGAALTRLEFKRSWGGKEGYLGTISPPSLLEKENNCFLLALSEKTPFYFNLVDKTEKDDRFVVSYKGTVDGGTVFKRYTVFKNSYRIDLNVSFQNISSELGKPRIFIASPLVAELIKDDTITGLANDGPTTVKVLPKTDKNLNSYWSQPTLFGTQDRYFVHALVNDPNNFTQRGYFKAVGLDSMYAILEGPAITGDQSWDLSFYMGPKEDDAMAAVDGRLEQTLNYGYFSIISKPLSKLLLDALNFFYGYVQNYGIALIILTILLKLIMLPFTIKGEESMKKRTEFQRKMEHLQSRYKNNPQALAEARAELVRRDGLPGLGGCLPLLLQIPMFWALSITLSNSIELYQAPFLWISDLSVRDPYYILPILTAVGIILHSPSVDAKQRMSSIMMALVVSAFLSSMSAGLTLYIVVSTFLGVAQSYLVKRFK